MRLIISAILILGLGLAGCRPTPSPTAATLVTSRPVSLQGVQVVFLRSAQPAVNEPPLLLELGRQAILLALREELGLATRDEALGDEAPMPPDASVATLRLRVERTPAGGWTLAADLEDGPGTRAVCELPLDPPTKADDDFYPLLVQRLEERARTDIVRRLQEAGAQGQPRPPAGQTTLGPQEVADQESAHVLRQWRALRLAHTASVVAGPSPDLTAGLARGYARLALMHPDLAAPLAARALLYAQRLKNMGGDPPVQRLCWCEALFAAGLHDAAHAALTESPLLPGDYAAALRLACHFEVQALKELWQRTQAPAIGNLWVLALRTTPTLTLQRQRAAAQVLEREPGALHLVEGRLPMAPAVELNKQLGDWLPRFNDLPHIVRQVLDQPRGLRLVLGNLVELGRRPADRFEPSWTVLARRVQDLVLSEALLHATARRLEEAPDWEDLVDAQAAVLRGHPGLPRLIDLKRAPPPRELEVPTMPLPPVDPWSAASTDLPRLLAQLRLSPRHPAVLAALIGTVEPDRPGLQAEVKAWGQKHVVVLEALANAARRHGDAAGELAAWQKRVLLSPDRYAYEELARLQLEQGRVEEWQATLEKYLEQSASLRDRTEVQVALARVWLKRGDSQRALPFGTQASRSGLPKGMLCGIDCLTAVGKFDEAEQLARRYVQVRHNEPHVWLFWCLRTGKGDTEAAWRHVDEYLAGLTDQGNLYDCELRGVVALLRDRPEQASEAFQQAWQQGKQRYALQHLVLSRFDLKKGDLREILMWAFTLNGGGLSWDTPERWYAMLTYTPGEEELKILRNEPAATRANQGYFLGRLCELHGLRDQAIACYQISVSADEPWLWNSVLAQVRLRALSRR